MVASTVCGILKPQWNGDMTANHRQSVRWPILDDNSPTVLVANGRSHVCKLVERSLGGFGVITGETVHVGENKPIRLKTRGLEYSVRLAFQKPEDDTVYLGLELLEEILPDNMHPPASASAKWLTTVAWVVALSIVTVAVYCISGMSEYLPMKTGRARPVRPSEICRPRLAASPTACATVTVCRPFAPTPMALGLNIGESPPV